ncbi:hypothetical protein ACFSUS_06170 [Spirosoma soli]|uniref:Lipoprotein n=1 Tax=Spirosoma soli TaxID=1770529 RepID=A0ABW5M0W2_9BACT
MKKLLYIFLVTLGGCSPKTSAVLTTQPNRILYASTDINQATDDSVARIKPGGFILGKNIKVTLRTGERRIIPRKDIWGYSDEKGKVWRCFKKTFYQVVQIGDVVEYEVIELRNTGNNLYVNEPVRLYSKTLDSKIVGSRKRALRAEDEQKAE